MYAEVFTMVLACITSMQTCSKNSIPTSSSRQVNGMYVSNFYNGTSPHDLGANGAPLNPLFTHPFSPSFADANAAGAYLMPFNMFLLLQLRL